jgi:hypothetical protein
MHSNLAALCIAFARDARGFALSLADRVRLKLARNTLRHLTSINAQADSPRSACKIFISKWLRCALPQPAGDSVRMKF